MSTATTIKPETVDQAVIARIAPTAVEPLVALERPMSTYWNAREEYFSLAVIYGLGLGMWLLGILVKG
jgi:hypothetical protein